MIDSDEKKVLGFLILHPHSKLPALCIGLDIDIYAIDAALKSLTVKGIVKGDGYASHTEEYYVPGAAEFLKYENIGRVYMKVKS